jgi:hypothetical protein
VKRAVYDAALVLTGIFTVVAVAVASTLLYGEVTLPAVLTAMLSAVIASAFGAVAICTYQSEYELEQARARRAFKRLKNAGPPPVPGTHR